MVKKLQQKKYRDKEKLFVIEGEHLVLEAYKQGLLKEIFVLEDKNYDYDVIKNYVSYEVMKKITLLDKAPDVIGICYIKENKIDGDKILLVDNVQDPGNLGTIIRSAVAFNVKTIVLSNDTVDLYNSKVLRSAQGMNFYINIVSGDLIKIIGKLKKEDYYIYGTSLTADEEIKNVKIKKKYGLVIGNEGSGVRKDILDLCDECFYIKMNQNCESLNVGIATAIILYELDK